MAEWDYAYRRSLPDSHYACIDPGGTKDENGHTDEDHRHYPLKDKAGNLDAAHVRNALSRLAQDDTTSCGAAAIRAAAKELGIGRPAGKSAEVPESEGQLAHAVKFVGPDTIEGPVFLYNRDLYGESFTPDTDLCIDWFGKSGRPLLYEHGLDPALKARIVGRQSDYESREEGVWAQAELDKSARFRRGIDALIERGALGYSGGAMQHLTTKSASGALRRFPWVELSLTPTPANPANASVYYLKSALAIEHLEAADVPVPDPLKAALSALDQWADSRDDEALPDGASFADVIDRLTVDAAARVAARKAWNLKSGRVLSAATRERLVRHPAQLRELADDLDELLTSADQDRATKSSGDLWEQQIEAEAAYARLLGVTVPERGAIQ